MTKRQIFESEGKGELRKIYLHFSKSVVYQL